MGQQMWDAALVWGGDLTVGATGDLLLAKATALDQQRLLRRLLTNPTDYLWQPAYGAGLGQFVGQANSSQAVAGLIYAQMTLESCVAKLPPPTVTADASSDGNVVIGIRYADAASGQSQSVSFSMGA
jgi:phage baseplate assembly protein W